MSGGGEGSYFGNSGSFNGRNAVKIVCLTKEGNYVSTFDSVKKGQEFCGHKLYNALNGNTKTTGGYLWLYETEYNKLSEIELKDFVQNCNTNNSSKNGVNTRFGKVIPWNSGKNDNKIVYQYSKENVLIKEWKNAKEAISFFDINEKYAGKIERCIYEKRKTAYGYKWSYKNS